MTCFIWLTHWREKQKIDPMIEVLIIKQKKIDISMIIKKCLQSIAQTMTPEIKPQTYEWNNRLKPMIFIIFEILMLKHD